MQLRFPTRWVSMAAALLVTVWLPYHIQARLPAASPIITPSITPLPSPSATPSVIGRTDNSLTAVIASGTGKAIAPGSCRGVASRIGVDPGQVVTITLLFPASRSGEPVTVQALDGGLVAASPRVLSNTGIVQFQFQANQAPGLTQVLVRLGADDFGLQFYVLDTKRPERNPNIPTLATIQSVIAASVESTAESRQRPRRGRMRRPPLLQTGRNAQ